jgi:hypothetical protein
MKLLVLVLGSSPANGGFVIIVIYHINQNLISYQLSLLPG